MFVDASPGFSKSYLGQCFLEGDASLKFNKSSIHITLNYLRWLETLKSDGVCGCKVRQIS